MVSHDEYLALHERSGLVDRSDRGLLRLTGPDRRSYLQGLLTNDIAALTGGTGCYAALLTAQGRMISDMRVSETGDEILMDLPGATAARVRDHLTQFIFTEDVAVDDLAATAFQCGIYGPEAPATLAGALATIRGLDDPTPATADLERLPLFGNIRQPLRGTPLVIVRSDEIGVVGFDVMADASVRDALFQGLAGCGATSIGDEVIEVCRIEAGRPLFGIDMDEDTIPLEAGITERAISLTKGCYVGQEIIIRVLHRGHGRVARRLVGFRVESDAVPVRGTVVKVRDRDIGRVTSAAMSPRLGAPVALGYVHRDFTEPGTRVILGGAAGEQPATVVETPFVR